MYDSFCMYMFYAIFGIFEALNITMEFMNLMNQLCNYVN